MWNRLKTYIPELLTAYPVLSSPTLTKKEVCYPLPSFFAVQLNEGFIVNVNPHLLNKKAKQAILNRGVK